MDLLYESDHKLGDFEDADMMDNILDNDVFSDHSPSSMSSDGYMDNDWLNSLFEDPVLNDKMITDAVPSPRIQSEHSYSINNETVPESPLGLGKLEDLDTEFFGNNTQALDLTTKATSLSTTATTNSLMTVNINTPAQPIKSETSDLDSMFTTVTATTTRTVNKQPTIILATSGTSNISRDQLQLPLQQTSNIITPTVMIKTEPHEYIDTLQEQTANIDTLILPPTPPGSSSSSDSEGGQSPLRSEPSSPVRHMPIRSHSSSSSPTSSKPYSQPLFTNPIPQSGVLILSEEEKRTLISEGYPIPNKLPLTKQEEKNLKKIRRKIKNKISAQESRRKKKEYLETLEKRVEAFSQENNDLKKKVDSLENNNRSLLSQLQKLQNLVGKVTGRPAGGSTQTGTALMVLVLCFAVFLGGWSPSSLNIGYSSQSRLSSSHDTLFSNPQLMQPSPRMGPHLQDPKVGSYDTPIKRSRVLASLREDHESSTWYEPYGPIIPKSGTDFQDKAESTDDGNVKDIGPNLSGGTIDKVSLERSKVVEVVTVDQRVGQPNNTGTVHVTGQATMHPDIAASPDFLNAHVESAVETA